MTIPAFGRLFKFRPRWGRYSALPPSQGQAPGLRESGPLRGQLRLPRSPCPPCPPLSQDWHWLDFGFDDAGGRCHLNYFSVEGGFVSQHGGGNVAEVGGEGGAGDDAGFRAALVGDGRAYFERRFGG